MANIAQFPGENSLSSLSFVFDLDMGRLTTTHKNAYSYFLSELPITCLAHEVERRGRAREERRKRISMIESKGFGNDNYL